MANYKRKRSRIHMGIGSSNDLKRKFSLEDWRWWQGIPSSHNILFHTRPRRREERRLERLVLRGEDADNMTWPLYKKPHEYYW
jgi:hypothetical protein